MQLMLLIRQHSWFNDTKQLTLSDQEKMSISADKWKQLVENNKHELAKVIQNYR